MVRLCDFPGILNFDFFSVNDGVITTVRDQNGDKMHTCYTAIK